MITLQEYLDQKYPTREDKEEEIGIFSLEINRGAKPGITKRLDLSYYSNLKIFDLSYPCSGFLINEINLEQNENLTNLSLNNCQLTSINLNKNKNLKELSLCGNKLAKINLDENKNLEKLCLSDNQLTSINLDKNTKLNELNLNTNQLTNVNLEKNTSLISLYLQGNKLTSVDFLNQLPQPNKLEILKVSSNNIQPTNIEIFSKFINLKELKIGT